MKILIADPHNASFYEVAFKDHSITKAGTSEEALERLAEGVLNNKRFDVLIVNQRLPGLMAGGGCELIKNSRGLAKVIVMATTEECEAAAMAAGATAFFPIPLPINQLKEIVERASEFQLR